MTRTFGNIELVKLQKDQERQWIVTNKEFNDGYAIPFRKKGTYFKMTEVEPHVCIEVKNIFPKIRKSEIDEFWFAATEETCHKLLWFMDMYALVMDKKTQSTLRNGRRKHLAYTRELEGILNSGYSPGHVVLKSGFIARDYQAKGAEIFLIAKKMILADYLGLGKSLTATLPMIMEPKKLLPALIVCQTHMPHQWKHEVIEKFTSMSAYMIPRGPVKKLPVADVYIIPYSRIAKWGSVLAKMIKYVIFDEVQELRVPGSDKYRAAQNICERIQHVQGLSHTPLYNYGIEIFNIYNCIGEGLLGDYQDFARQWGERMIKNGSALGSYLRERFLMVRRTDKEVGRELPKLNTILKTVEYDEHEVDEFDVLTADLALSYYSSTSFSEKGQLGREFDMRLRQETGVAKATGVAALVSLLCESGEKVLLSGWHRAVYDIWLDLLKDFNPVMYTGSETPEQKMKAKQAFTEGDSRVMIISNRSGVGLDGLQFVCRHVVIGELDWSPKVHEQIVGRVRRDGQEHPVTAYYPTTDDGSDPAMVEMLGIKNSQQHAIMDPFSAPVEQFTDESRIKRLAESYLVRKNQKGLQKLIKGYIETENYEKAVEIQKLLDEHKRNQE